MSVFVCRPSLASCLNRLCANRARQNIHILLGHLVLANHRACFRVVDVVRLEGKGAILKTVTRDLVCYRVVLGVLQERYESVTRVYQGCDKDVTRVSQECCESVIRVLPPRSHVLQGASRGSP